MPICILLLSRFTLCVNKVLFRIYETGIYHSFESAPSTVVRDTRGWEASYESVKGTVTLCPT